jgi:membrane-associated phospholipid phosphatase
MANACGKGFPRASHQTVGHELMSLPGRLRSQLGLKLVLTGLLNLSFYFPYSFLQHHQWFRVEVAPVMSLDSRIPFWDQAVWPYLSLFLLMPIGPFLMRSRNQLFRYAAGFLLIEFLSYAVFVLMPTWCPRPSESNLNFAYRLLTRFDGPMNAFPSLHAAFASFSALCVARVSRELTGQARWRILTGIWAIAILGETLVTKQHRLADVVAGLLIGVAAGVYVFKERSSIHPRLGWRGPVALHPVDSHYEP